MKSTVARPRRNNENLGSTLSHEPGKNLLQTKMSSVRGPRSAPGIELFRKSLLQIQKPTVRTPQPTPGDEILISPRPRPHPGHPHLHRPTLALPTILMLFRPRPYLNHPCLHRPTLTSPRFLTTHSLGTNSHLMYYSKSHPTYVTTDTHCSVSLASAATGVECLSNVPLIGPKSRPNTLQSCLNCGCNGPTVCPLTQIYPIFLQACTVNLYVCGQSRLTCGGK